MPRFENIPDVSFMGDITLSGLKKKIIELYNTAYTEITGKQSVISDEIKAILYADAQLHYQSVESLDKKARQNLLKYSSGEYLDNLANGRCEPRKEAESSVVKERFKLSAARERITAIPKGTRFTSPGGNVYFATTDYAEIAPGDLYIDVQGRATTGGSITNQFAVGELNILVDPIPYIASVTNIDEPSGGADRESDDAFAERINLSKYIYSTTGSESAYRYYTMSYSTLIDDVIVLNPEGARIDIYILLKDRSEASNSFIEGLLDFLREKDKRPLTDKVNVYNVERIGYSIDVEYTIYESDISNLGIIQEKIAAAIEEYKNWQCAKIGRDINNQKLISLMIKAGAATVNVKAPNNTMIAPEQIAYCDNVKVEYKGMIEN